MERAGEGEAGGSVLGTRVCASLSVCTALGKGQVTPEGERRKRKRSVNVLYTPVHKAPAVPVPSNKSLFRKNVKASLGGEKNNKKLTLDSVENEHKQWAGSRRKQKEKSRNQSWVLTGTAGWWVAVWEGTHTRVLSNLY